jgi:hypothetical protein
MMDRGWTEEPDDPLDASCDYCGEPVDWDEAVTWRPDLGGLRLVKGHPRCFRSALGVDPGILVG